MDIQQAELLREVSKDFIQGIRSITTKKSCKEGDVIFRKGDPARYLYVLLTGRVRLSIGETGRVAHIVSRPGEGFGWSSLVDRDAYAGFATCENPTILHKIDAQKLSKILEKDPQSASRFFKHLAGMLGNRLLQSYGRYEKLFERDTLV